MQTIKATSLCLTVLLLVCAAAAASPDKHPSAGPKDNSLMPASVSSDLEEAKNIKKALEDAEKDGRTEASEVRKAARELLNLLRAALRGEVRRGDPKTDYVQSENRFHSAKQSAGSEDGLLDLTGWINYSQVYVGDTIMTTYTYEVSADNPYPAVVVVYESASGEILSATGYITTRLSEAPDLQGMTLIFTARRSDGTLAYQKYVSEPDASGATTQVILYYDSTGTNVTSGTQSFIQPLDLTRTKLPSLR